MTPKIVGNMVGIPALKAGVAVHTVEVGAQEVTVMIASARVRAEAVSRRVKAIEQKEEETGK